MYNTYKKTSLLLCLHLLYACGNRHVVDRERSRSDDQLKVTQTEILYPGEMESKILLKIESTKSDKILEFKNSPSEFISITNLSNVSYDLKASLKSTTHFSFTGGNYPGVNGTCEKILEKRKNCLVEISYSPKSQGVHVSNLQLDYQSMENKDVFGSLTFPIRGENKEQTISSNEDVNLQLRSLTNKEELFFGKSIAGKNLIGTVILKNITDAKTNYQIKPLNHFEVLEDSCLGVIEAKKNCFLKINFNSAKLGLLQENLTVEYNTSFEKKNTQLKLWGEKIATGTNGNESIAQLSLSDFFNNLIEFQRIMFGSSLIRQIEIINSGNLATTINQFQFNQNSPFNFTGGAFPGINGTCNDVIPSGTCIIEIIYSPKNEPKTGAQIVFNYNSTNLTINLAGTATTNTAGTCFEKSEYFISPEFSFNPSLVVFPYVLSKSNTTAKLSTLYGTQTNAYVNDAKTYTVKDAMVLNSFELPKLADQISEINLHIEILKVINDSHSDTETLCLSSDALRTCSGRLFDLDSWLSLKNPKFFDQYVKPVNTLYESTLSSGSYQCGSKTCLKMIKNFNLSTLFSLNQYAYNRIAHNDFLHFIFSDDTRITKMPRLTIKTQKEISCK